MSKTVHMDDSVLLCLHITGIMDRRCTRYTDEDAVLNYHVNVFRNGKVSGVQITHTPEVGESLADKRVNIYRSPVGENLMATMGTRLMFDHTTGASKSDQVETIDLDYIDFSIHGANNKLVKALKPVFEYLDGTNE